MRTESWEKRKLPGFFKIIMFVLKGVRSTLEEGVSGEEDSLKCK